MLPSTYPNRETIIDQYLKIAGGEKDKKHRIIPAGVDDVVAQYRQATELYCADLLQKGTNIEHVRCLLRDMTANEQAEYVQDRPTERAPTPVH